MQPPTNNEQAGLSLPTPVPEAPNGPTPPTETSSSSPEARPSGAEQAPVNSQAPPAALPLSASAQAQAVAQSATRPVVDDTTPLNLPADADDTDLIEKEWVNKAKRIVEKTADNPYQQSKEMTIFRADYMKKRYNKVIKLSE